MWKKKRTEEKLSKSISFETVSNKDIYRLLFLESRDGIVLIRAQDGQIIDANPEFQRQTGRTLDELKKLKIWQLKPLEKRIRAKEVYSKIIENGIGKSRELEFQKPDGTITNIDFISKLVKINNDDYLLSISRNISESKKIENKLIEQRQKLLKQRDELELFAPTVAHDIRGKLQIISMFNELTTDSIYKEKIFDQINEISNFLENLLVLAKKGEIIGEMRKIDLENNIEKIINKVKHLEPNLVFKIEEDLPEIKGDITKINQVLENIILNIIKHSKATEVKIYAKESPHSITICFEDNGTGIEKDDLKTIFDLENTKSYKSLGLQIVKKVMEAHKGSFEIRSKKGEGTLVLIHFPKNSH